MSGITIELARLRLAYGENPALDDLSLVAPSGRVTAVVGPSGSGKSTLLQVVAGLLRPQRGDVLFDGLSVLDLPPEKRQLGVVFQSYALFPHLTVAANVAFGPTVRRVDRRAVRSQVAAVLDQLEIGHLAQRLPHELSGGEQQRVALARALACRPRALLLDEPLSALDSQLRLALRAELAERLQAAAVTVLYVTHDQEEAMALGDRVAVVHRGGIEQVGRPEELYRFPATPFVASFVGEANFLPVGWDPESRRLRGPLGEWTMDAATTERFNGVRQGRLMVRPEAFRPAGIDEAHLTGQVLATTFLGDKRRLRLAVAGAELKVDLPASDPVAVGSRLPLAIDFSSTVLLPEFDPAAFRAGGEKEQPTRAGGSR